ncbi:MAG: hypothetical protein IAF38_22060 [Bacteroidia bacterium]|nr:hypothetical protein [Bacteroidia bacterium]
MPVSLKEAYQIGFNPNYLGAYFNSVEFVSSKIETNDQRQKEIIMGHVGSLKKLQPLMPQLVVTVQDIFTREGWPSTEPPRFPNDFYKWANNFDRVFKEKHPDIQSPLNLAYEFGKKVGDFYSSFFLLNIVSNVADLMKTSFPKQVENIVNPLKNSFLLFEITAKLAGVMDKSLVPLHDTWLEFLKTYLDKIDAAGLDYALLNSICSSFLDEFNEKEKSVNVSFLSA